MTVTVTAVQRFCTHDGPGIRTTVFLKGCPLRCAWCHNPETQSAQPDFFYVTERCVGCGACVRACPAGAHRLQDGVHMVERERCTHCLRCAAVCLTEALEPCGREMTVEEIIGTVIRDTAFYGDEGGLTLSGGEPLFHPAAALAILRAAKEAGIRTAVETCGCFDGSILPELVPLTDLFLWDLKDTDDRRHRAYTGVSVAPIRENLRRADALGAAVRLRCILVEGVNTDEAHYQGIADCFHALSRCEGVELLPYHAYGSSKARQLGADAWGGADRIPSPQTIRKARKILRDKNVKVQ